MKDSTQPIYFIFDFDSTIIKLESLDELARISLKANPQKADLLQKIEQTTRLGMEGKLTFPESLAKRLELFHTNRKLISKTGDFIKKHITPSFSHNKKFLSDFKDQIYILSGGFKELILPTAIELGLKHDHILANEFRYDKDGNVIGIDQSNLLAQEKGKVKMMKRLRANGLEGKIIVIGDGYSDYEVYETGLCDNFFAFAGNIEREAVISKSINVATSLDEILFKLKLPRSEYYPKTKLKVLLLENISKEAVELFKANGYSVETIETALTESELQNKIKNVSILGIRSRTQITKSVLKKANRLIAIGAFCIGTNQIDIDACTRQGIAVFNAPFENTRSVVELTIGLIIMLLRNTFLKSNKLHKGEWDKSVTNCYELRGKKLGIIGYGKIGSQLSVLAEMLGMEVKFYDIEDRLALGNAKPVSSMHEILSWADIVTIHVDGRKANVNLISHSEFKIMKAGTIFLNLSRGEVVDIKALGENLKSGKLIGAAVDVYPTEPKANGEEFKCVLQNLNNVILTPHVGGNTIEAQSNIGKYVVKKITNFIDNGSTNFSVGFPEITLPDQHGVHRLIHIHHNKPGVLANINQVLSKANLNILGQYLKTNDQIGYVITDVDNIYDPEVIDRIKKVPGTIKFRVLY